MSLIEYGDVTSFFGNKGMEFSSNFASGEFQLLYSFVSVREGISMESIRWVVDRNPKMTRQPMNGWKVYDLVHTRTTEELQGPTHEFVLDSIDADWFDKLSLRTSTKPCKINDEKDSKIRMKFLDELLQSYQISLVSVLLSEKSKSENGYIENFEPSTWHKIILGKFGGIPAIQTRGDEDSDGTPTRLLYAGPVSRSESNRLFELISLNHVPDFNPFD